LREQALPPDLADAGPLRRRGPGHLRTQRQGCAVYRPVPNIGGRGGRAHQTGKPGRHVWVGSRLWKGATRIQDLHSRETRSGTYDVNLNRIGR
jgi:hypothetical protein